MRTWIIAFSLMIFLFFLPLQCFIIGDNLGLGVQGGVLRYQIVGGGTSLIPLPYEIGYITSGTYTGRTAVSVIFWVLGTLVLTWTTILSLVFWNNISRRDLQFVITGIAGTCFLYLASCIAQYGLFFSGPTGISLPAGILILSMYAAFLHFYRDLFNETNTLPDKY